MPKFNYWDVSVIYDEEFLIIANRCLCRKISLTNGILRTVELWDLRTNCLVATENPEFDFNFIGYNVPNKNNAEFKLEDITIQDFAADLFDAERVEVKINVMEMHSAVRYTRTYIIYPGQPFLSAKNCITPEVLPNIYWTYRQKLRCECNREQAGPLFSTVDALSFSPQYSDCKTVEFLGRTDEHIMPVFEHDAAFATSFGAHGNLLYAVNPVDNSGALILQEAPPSAERRDMEEFDFYHIGNTVFSCNWGIAPHELLLNQPHNSYRHTIILFANQSEQLTAAHKYLKHRYPDRLENHTIMVNPWGGGDFYKRLTPEFLAAELDATAKIGAETYQIDDSWQQGKSLWELIIANRNPRQDFWQIDYSRFPEGFEPFVEQARRNNLELALWLAPSGNLDYADCEYFGRLITEFNRKYQFRFFKIDSMVLRSYAGEQQLTAMFRRLRQESNGEIYFNLDVTNGQRGGYFYLLEYGNLFLQNRYVMLDWGCVDYHPEKTLHAVWKLAKYTRIQTLQVEIPCRAANLRRHGKTKSGCRCMPECYNQEYWAAIALFANPLIWLYPSEVNDVDAESLRNVISLHKKYRKQILNSEILPIGFEPDGLQFTGLQSHNAADNSGLIIVFREYGCAYSNDDLTLAITLPDNCVLTPVAGHGNAKMTNGRLQVEIPMPADWVLFKY